MGMEPSEYNVVFVTIDSCTYDSASRANTHNLLSLSPLRKAETHGSFTFPAHMSFFIGNLPNLIDGNTYYFERYSQIWRSVAARPSKHQTIAIPFRSKNILDYYHERNCYVLGVGGVSFFNIHRSYNSLPSLFPNFIYYGPKEYVPREERIPRPPSDFPLNHLDEIIQKLPQNKPFFLFVNSPTTHIPYDSPNLSATREYKDAVLKAYIEHDNKVLYPVDRLPLTSYEINLLKNAQVLSLEWVDRQLGELFSNLPNRNRPTLIVVCSDHGEEFGEGGRFGHAHIHETVYTVPMWIGVLNSDKV